MAALARSRRPRTYQPADIPSDVQQSPYGGYQVSDQGRDFSRAVAGMVGGQYGGMTGAHSASPGYSSPSSRGYQPSQADIDANARGASANEAAAKKKQELMAQGMSEAEAHQQASQVYAQMTGDGGSGQSSGQDSGGYSVSPGYSSPGSGSNIYRDSLMGTPISQMPGSSVPYYSGNDIAKQYENNRNIEQNQGDRYDQLFGGEYSRRVGLENASALRGQDLYGDLERNPGYTPQEQDKILREGEYQGLLNTDYGSNFLTGDEQSQIRGNPYDPMNQLHPENLHNQNTTAFDASRGYIQGTGDQLNQSYEGLKSGLDDSMDLSQTSATGLKLGQGYQNTMGNVVNTTGEKVWGATQNPGLSVADDYKQKATLSDQEVEDAGAQSGQALGSHYRSAVQDLERQSAADGNSSPLAVGAMRAQFEDQNAVAQADAVNQGRLNARKMQADLQTGAEKTRLGAEQYKTGAEMDAGMGLGRFAADSATQQENMRMNSARDISNRKAGIATQLGNTSRDNAMYTGDQNLQAERDWANRGQQAEMYNQTQGYNASRNAEQQQSDRAGAVATNRQNVNIGNQDSQYRRGYQVASTQSGLNQGVADARRQGQGELRNYYTGQQQYQGQQANQQQQNMLQNRQQTQQGRDQATRGSTAWELGNKQSGNWFTKNVIPTISAVANVGNAASNAKKAGLF